MKFSFQKFIFYIGCGKCQIIKKLFQFFPHLQCVCMRDYLALCYKAFSLLFMNVHNKLESLSLPQTFPASTDCDQALAYLCESPFRCSTLGQALGLAGNWTNLEGLTTDKLSSLLFNGPIKFCSKWARCYETFSDRNLRTFVISQSVCP